MNTVEIETEVGFWEYLWKETVCATTPPISVPVLMSSLHLGALWLVLSLPTTGWAVIVHHCRLVDMGLLTGFAFPVVILLSPKGPGLLLWEQEGLSAILGASKMHLRGTLQGCTPGELGVLLTPLSESPARCGGWCCKNFNSCLHVASMTSTMTQLAKSKLRAAGATVIYAANICPEFYAMAGTFTTPVTANQTPTAPLSTTPGKMVTACLDTTVTDPPVPTFVHTSPNSTGKVMHTEMV